MQMGDYGAKCKAVPPGSLFFIVCGRSIRFGGRRWCYRFGWKKAVLSSILDPVRYVGLKNQGAACYMNSATAVHHRRFPAILSARLDQAAIEAEAAAAASEEEGGEQA